MTELHYGAITPTRYFFETLAKNAPEYKDPEDKRNLYDLLLSGSTYDYISDYPALHTKFLADPFAYWYENHKDNTDKVRDVNVYPIDKDTVFVSVDVFFDTEGPLREIKLCDLKIYPHTYAAANSVFKYLPDYKPRLYW